MQHVAYAQQLHWKSDTVREALRRISHVDIELPDVVPSPKERNYRSRVTFTLIRLPGGRVVAGFHHLSMPHRIVDVEEGCILPEPAVASVWTGLRRAWGEGARRLPAGRKLRLTLRAVDEGVILVVEGGRGPGPGHGGPGSRHASAGDGLRRHLDDAGRVEGGVLAVVAEGVAQDPGRTDPVVAAGVDVAVKPEVRAAGGDEAAEVAREGRVQHAAGEARV